MSRQSIQSRRITPVNQHALHALVRLADRSVSAQELNAQMPQDFFNGVINNLRTQAENNRALSEDLIEQQRKQQEASQALAQESVNAYMDVLNSMFSDYRGNLDEAQRRTNR